MNQINNQQIEATTSMNNKIKLKNKLEDEESDEQQQELENIIKDLEEENIFLIEEYTRLQSQLNSRCTDQKSTSLEYSHASKYQRHHVTDILGIGSNAHYSARALSSSPTPTQQQINQTLNYSSSNYYHPISSNGSLNLGLNGSMTTSIYNKVPLLFKPTQPLINHSSTTAKSEKENQILEEARMLRQHEDRLEARMKILENHNRLLDSQLKQLKSLLNNVINYSFLFENIISNLKNSILHLEL